MTDLRPDPELELATLRAHLDLIATRWESEVRSVFNQAAECALEPEEVKLAEQLGNCARELRNALDNASSVSTRRKKDTQP